MKQGGEHSGGFTILETMIVLAVSAGLAVLAMMYVGGRQNRTEFMVAINNAQQQIQQIINETNSGYYPFQGANNINCTALAPNHPTVNRTGSGSQGANGDCIFIGKFLQFGINGANPSTVAVYPLVGNRFDSSGEVTSLTAANPVALSSKGSLAGVPDFSSTFSLENGLTVDHMYYIPLGGGSNVNMGMVGFISSFASYNGCSGICSGSQQFSLYSIKSPTSPPGASGQLNATQTNAVDAIDASPAVNLLQVSEVDICLKSGGTNQSGLLTIGSGSSNGLAVGLTIKVGTVC